MKFYKYNSVPLLEVGLGSLEDGEDYVNDEGTKLRYVEDDNQLLIIQPSELTLGNTMESLTNRKTLKTYWQLMKYFSEWEKEKRLKG